MEKFKRLPYGISNFEVIRTENYAYVDKTRFIEMLEDEPNGFQFFIRPRKFGKSLFFSTLSNYYDINKADQFEQLFGDLYIGKNPSPKKNVYAVMQFNFSGINTNKEEDFKKSFCRKIEHAVIRFFGDYKNIFSRSETLISMIENTSPGIEALEIAYNETNNSGLKMFVIIDEYDHFANDLIAMGTFVGDDIYRRMVRANGLVRDFYEALKTGTSGVLDRIFITGISPVMLDDLTSGFNVAANLTPELQYNEMMGFTQEEVDALMIETGVNPKYINVDMKAYYDGYLFHKNANTRVYNPSMILYFFNRILKDKQAPQDIIDDNLKTDYGRLQRLVQNEENREKLLEIITNGGITTEIISKFSIDRLFDNEYFVSLLFYMGLLTIEKPDFAKVRLCIPNYSIETIYWEYFRLLLRDTSPCIKVDISKLDDSIKSLAMEGDPEAFVNHVSSNVFSKLSNRDLMNFSEKYIQIMLLSYLFQSRIYVPVSEYEVESGYADIYMKRSPLLSQIKYEWIFELKYLKTGDENQLPLKREEALSQLKRYTESAQFQGRSDLKAAAVIFIGKDKYEIIRL